MQEMFLGCQFKYVRGGMDSSRKSRGFFAACGKTKTIGLVGIQNLFFGRTAVANEDGRVTNVGVIAIGDEAERK